MRISERAESPLDAKSVAMRCTACGKLCFVNFIYGTDRVDRMRLMKKALDEHRMTSCTAGGAEERREYTLWYPRA